MTDAEKALLEAAIKLGAFDNEAPFFEFNRALIAVKKERLDKINPEWKEQLRNKHYERWTARYRYRDERARMVAHVGDDVVQELEAEWRKQGEMGPE